MADFITKDVRIEEVSENSTEKVVVLKVLKSLMVKYLKIVKFDTKTKFVFSEF